MTTQPDSTAHPGARATRGRLFFVALLLLAGLGLVGVAGYRLLVPPKPTRDLAAEARADLERRGYRPLSQPLQRLLSDPEYKPVPTQVHPLLGEQAPDFTLEEVNGPPWHLAEQRGKGPLVLVFYYGYHCDHCVSQLFGLNRDLEKFSELGASVAAVEAIACFVGFRRHSK